MQVYVGNYEYDADERELERLFDKFGKVDHVEFKSGAPRRPPARRVAACRPLLPASCLPGNLR